MKKNIYILKKIILLLISILSIVLLMFIYNIWGEYSYNVDSGLGILLFASIIIILGIVRVITSLKTNLSIIFRIQDFIYAFFIVFPFLGISLGDNNHVSFIGKTITVISIISSFLFLIRLLFWRYNNIKENE